MIWLLRDLDLLLILLHAAALSFEALLLGAVAFVFLQAERVQLPTAVLRAWKKLATWSSLGLVTTEAATMATSSATMLAGASLGSSMGWRDLLSASFLRAEALTILFAALLGWLLRRSLGATWHRTPQPSATAQPSTILRLSLLVLASGLLASIVWLSHATSQMEHRTLLALLTAAHHLGTAAWIGAMPYLLLALANRELHQEDRQMLVRRYSAMALVSVAVLVAAGVGMAWFYVGSWTGLYGTSYGLMLLAKVYLLLLMLVLGAGNWYLLRTAGVIPESFLLRLRRAGEAELGLGFTILLAAASLTAQSPSIDINPQDRASAHAYTLQMTPEWPRLSSPPLHALAPPSSMREGVKSHQFGGGSTDDANDKAWSEYNHHWAGLMVLAAGLLALLSRSSRLRWARYWPLSFAGLAVFIVLRADPEAWPLGPRPFWASFSYPDVLEHRLEALLVLAFAAFEAAVQAGRLHRQWASFVFPLICALGAALLLTHTHGMGDAVGEVLAEASHTLIAVLGATAAWARWLELRLPASRTKDIAAIAWPAALVLVALVLLNYREA